MTYFIVYIIVGLILAKFALHILPIKDTSFIEFIAFVLISPITTPFWIIVGIVKRLKG